MGKVSFGADASAESTVDASPLKEPNMDGQRFNFHAPDGTYVTTVRAEDKETALAQARAENPGIDLIDPPGKTHRARFTKSAAGNRHNFFVMGVSGPEYVCTERADTEDEAYAAAVKNNPGVSLLRTSELPG